MVKISTQCAGRHNDGKEGRGTDVLALMVRFKTAKLRMKTFQGDDVVVVFFWFFFFFYYPTQWVNCLPKDEPYKLWQYLHRWFIVQLDGEHDTAGGSQWKKKVFSGEFGAILPDCWSFYSDAARLDFTIVTCCTEYVYLYTLLKYFVSIFSRWNKVNKLLWVTVWRS